MRTILFLLGALCGILLMGYLQEPCEKGNYLQLSDEAVLTLETVRNDTFIQCYILSPTERERTKRAKEMFNKKFPK